MRTVCSSFLALLVLAALFWGNCLSCPQMLLSQAAGIPPHGCCHHGKQPVKSHEDCQSFALKHFVKAPAAHQAPAQAPQPLPIAAAAPAPQAPPASPASVVELPQHSPPDLQILNATFRI